MSDRGFKKQAPAAATITENDIKTCKAEVNENDIKTCKAEVNNKYLLMFVHSIATQKPVLSKKKRICCHKE